MLLGFKTAALFTVYYRVQYADVGITTDILWCRTPNAKRAKSDDIYRIPLKQLPQQGPLPERWFYLDVWLKTFYFHRDLGQPMSSRATSPRSHSVSCWGRKIPFKPVKTTFYPPAVMECRSSLSFSSAVTHKKSAELSWPSCSPDFREVVCLLLAFYLLYSVNTLQM